MARTLFPVSSTYALLMQQLNSFTNTHFKAESKTTQTCGTSCQGQPNKSSLVAVVYGQGSIPTTLCAANGILMWSKPHLMPSVFPNG